MVFNEIKLYDDWRETYKDFAMQKKNYTEGGDITHGGLGPFPGQMVPRVIKTNVGDIFTTNTLVKANTDGKTDLDTGIDEAELEFDTPLFGEGIGLDSIDSIELISFIDDTFGVSMTGVAKENFLNIDTLASYIVANN